MFTSTVRTAVAAAAVATLLTAGAAIALDPGDTAITVSARTTIHAPSASPVDFPGVREARRGQPLPAGHTAIGYRVSITRGETTAYPSFTMQCPVGKRLRTMALQGEIGPQVIGANPFVRRRDFDYIGRRSWGVIADYNRRTVAVGETATGTVYGLCR